MADLRPSIALGLHAIKGGAALVALAVEQGAPRLLLSTVLETHEAGDRLSLEPYHVAAEMPRTPAGKASAAAAVTVAEGRARQDRLAAERLGRIVDRLEQTPATAALLVNRAGWVTDLLDYSLGWPEHVPVAEGLAVREALRSGLRACGIVVTEVDQKSLPDLAAHLLGLSHGAIDAQLKALGAEAKPWRKEQKFACLAAWVALTQR